MPLNPRPMEVLKMASIQAPFLCPLAIAGTAIINSEYFKAMFYMLGLMTLFGLHFFLSPLISGKNGRISKMRVGKREIGHLTYSSACHAFAIMGGSDYTSPAWSTSLLSFSFTYLLTPQLWNNYPPSPMFYILFIMFIFIDGLVRNKYLHCFGHNGWVPVWVGLAFGGIVGSLWFLFINMINSDLTFFNEPNGDRLKCNKPKKNHMKCTVYKDGVKSGSFLK